MSRRERWLRVGGLEMGICLPGRMDHALFERGPLHRELPPTPVLGPTSPDTSNGAPASRQVQSEKADPDAERLREEVRKVDWYHTIDLGDGIVTPGLVDHREQLPFYHFPESLAGMRCLDIASWDGYWAFEMERRGAKEVISFDVDTPAEIDIPAQAPPEIDRALLATKHQDRGFKIAREALGSRVERRLGNVYTLSPEELGTFDLVLISDLLVHLRDPQLAVERAFSVCRGTLVVADVYDPALERFGDRCMAEYSDWFPYFVWWRMNTNVLKKMLAVAGFAEVDELDRFPLQTPGIDRVPPQKVVLHARKAAAGDSSKENPLRPSPGSGAMSDTRRERWLRVGPIEAGLCLPSGADRRVFESAPGQLLRRLGGRNPRVPAPLPESDGLLPSRRPEPGDLDPEARKIAEAIAEHEWYHTIDLGHGVVTPGLVDHRPQLGMYHLPESLAGLRCLDVASWDGFWAFEMERRHAAEVISFDIDTIAEIDIPARYAPELIERGSDRRQDAGFKIAREVLGSKVERVTGSVYSLSPAQVGHFDLVFVSDLLLHLRDPQLALEHVFSVCQGTLILADVYHPRLERYGERSIAEYAPWLPGYTWWQMNSNTLKKMLAVAGFQDVEELERFELNVPGTGDRSHKVLLQARSPNRPRGGSPVLEEPAAQRV